MNRLLLPIVFLLLAVTGGLLIVDRPGLEASYFALGAPWEGESLYVGVGEPELDNLAAVSEVLTTEVVFSVRWRGWWDVTQGGEHGFALEADDGGYIRVDGEVVVDTTGVFGEVTGEGRKQLEPGFHRLELGLYQRHGESRMKVHWVAPGARDGVSLPPVDLYSGRPLSARRTLRGALGSWSRPYRQLLGAALWIAAVLLWRRQALRFEHEDSWRAAWQGLISKPGTRVSLLIGLFLVTFLVSYPFAGYLRGGDAIAYLTAATFNTEFWFSNRYGHVYLLKLFSWLSGGDPLVGVRVWWSFVFATTVSALAVAVRSVGTGLQLRTLAVTLFVLVSQTNLMGLIGNGLADFSAMMFVTVAVALYLRGFVHERERPPPRHEWYALVIGVLTIGAFRSKEVGAILLLLPLLFLFVDGSFDWRRFSRRLAYWTVGIVAALAVMMVLDGLILGDPLFTVGGDRMGRMERMNFPESRAARPNVDWLQTIWPARNGGGDLSLRFLWLGVCAAALAAGVARRRIELRLLHLLPIAYLLAHILLYVRMPHPFSPRMLITITPVACLMTGLLFHYCGLDDLAWRRLLSPGVLIPSGVLAGLVFFILVPYRLGTLEAAEFLPASYLARYGWAPDHFAVGVLLPAGFLLAVAALALGSEGRPLAVAALTVGLLTVFGPAFEITRASLAEHRANQLRDLLTYPWTTFESELAVESAESVELSADLQWPYLMSARGGSLIARLALGRSDVRVGRSRDFPADADVAIASSPAWTRWRRRMAPSLERALVATAKWDSAGFLVLLRPRAAALQAEESRRLAFTDEEALELHRHLAELAEDSSTGARGHFLERILASDSIRLRRIHGAQLRAVAVSSDGWTDGVHPAGLVVMNNSETTLVQELRLAVHASADDYPIRVFIDDGVELDTVVFERGGKREIELRPVAAGSSRLVIVWSDKAWSHRGAGSRRLGVRILPPLGP